MGPSSALPRRSSLLLLVAIGAMGLWPVPAYGQAGNGTVTVMRENTVAGGGRVGGGNPMQAVTVVGEPMGGTLSGTSYTVRGGVPTASADTTPPVITSPSASNITATTTSVTWTTNEPATSQVEYGLTTAYGSLTPLDATLVTLHAVTLTGLSASTLYHYRVSSKDAAGNLATSADLTFTTAAPDTTPPTGTITINSGKAATNNPTATLTLSATDNSGTVSQMQLSNDHVAYSLPEPYATTKGWTLTSGDGTKTVYVKFSDPSGNWSAPVSDSITCDATPPSVAITSPSDGTIVQ